MYTYTDYDRTDMLLSIDVGVRNLAMCMMTPVTRSLVQWEVGSLATRTHPSVFVACREYLDARPWLLEADVVLIERQPDRNKLVKSIEHFMHAYFVIKMPNAATMLYDARHKVPDIKGKGKALYRQRKLAAVQRCENFIQGHIENCSKWYAHFTESKKKDDLADTVMQALSYLDRMEKGWVPPYGKEVQIRNSVRPRKPTDHQKQTRYSKSNLAWMVKHVGYTELTRDARFRKDLKYHGFKDIDAIKVELLSA